MYFSEEPFYTKLEVSKKCCSIIKQFIDINFENDIIIEPSAGNGSFIPELLKMSLNCYFFDIFPEHPIVIQQDYLAFNNKTDLEPQEENSKIHVIGCPPIGRQSSTAIKFIHKSALFCDTISFILPKSFKDDNIKTKLPLDFYLLDFYLVHQCDLEPNSFIKNNKEYLLETIFQIWKRK
jgi:hypothetical protein